MIENIRAIVLTALSEKIPADRIYSAADAIRIPAGTSIAVKAALSPMKAVYCSEDEFSLFGKIVLEIISEPEPEVLRTAAEYTVRIVGLFQDRSRTLSDTVCTLTPGDVTCDDFQTEKSKIVRKIEINFSAYSNE